MTVVVICLVYSCKKSWLLALTVCSQKIFQFVSKLIKIHFHLMIKFLYRLNWWKHQNIFVTDSIYSRFLVTITHYMHKFLSNLIKWIVAFGFSDRKTKVDKNSFLTHRYTLFSTFLEHKNNLLHDYLILLLWWRANAQNISLLTIYGDQFMFSPQLLTLNYLIPNLPKLFCNSYSEHLILFVSRSCTDIM